MSFGFAPSDIAVGLQLCQWIYDNCFDKNGSADTKYLQFSKDVRRLDERLRQLRDALQQALDNSEDLDFDSTDTNPRQNPLQRESQELIGDFTATLAECREILVRHVSLQRDRAGFIQNVVWAASTQKKVDDLRARIQFHTQKIYLVIEPVQLRLASNIAGDVAEILWLMKQHLIPQQELVFKEIPEWLAARFYNALAKNPPTVYTDITHFPLKEGFDALYRHFRQSTVQFIDRETGEQTIEQYLELLKAQWILETLKRSMLYREARPGSLYTRIIGQVEQRISKQYLRQDLVVFGENELAKLNSALFLIWPAEVESTSRRLIDQDGQEEKILEISLSAPAGIRKHDLLVFRRSPTTLRLVRNAVNDDSGIAHPESEKVNTHVDRFIPWYAIPTSTPTLSVGICSGNGTGGTSLDFRSESDIFSFQRAYLGYQVVHDMPRATWALNKQQLRIGSKVLKGTARLQLWLWKPLPCMQAQSLEPSRLSTSPSSSLSGNSQWTNTTNATVAKITQRCDNSIVSVAENSNGNAVVAAVRPHLPRMVLFTKLDGKYTFLSLELQHGLQVVDTSCQCKKTPSSCRRSVIENRLSGGSPGTFVVQKLYVIMDQLEAWDLSILGRPQHPMFKDGSKVDNLTCKYLNLEFPTVPDRVKFNNDLQVALKLRDKDEKQYRKVSGNAEFLSHKPNHVVAPEKTATLVPSRPSSIVSYDTRKSSVCTTPRNVPSLGRFSQSTTFVGSPVFPGSPEKGSVFPPRKSSAASDNVRSPPIQGTSPLVPSVGRLSKLPVFSDSFSWTSYPEKVDFSAGDLPPDQQSPRQGLETHSDNLVWPVHSGDPWYPGKT